MSKIKLATVSMNVVFDKEKNLEKYFQFIDQAAAQGANLIVFPEASLQGYLFDMVKLTVDSAVYQHANAETIPHGASVQAIIEKAKAKNIYVIFGMIEQDEDQYDRLYNTAVLVGPDGYIGKYRKVHQPYDELHVYYPGHEWPVFETGIGRLGLLICYDKSFPESARELALKGADILTALTAWPLNAPGSDYNTDHYKYTYDLYDKVRAVENQCFFISANNFGISGAYEFFGFSRIVGPDGTVIAEVGFKEGMVIAEADIRQQITNARTIQQQLKDRKPDTYIMLSQK